MAKKILILVSHAPYSNNQNAAALDMMLAASGYEYDVSVVFSGQGILSLCRDQDPAAIGATDLLKSWQALPVYEVTELYVLQEDLIQQGIHSDELSLPVIAIPQTQLSALLEQHDILLRY